MKSLPFAARQELIGRLKLKREQIRRLSRIDPAQFRRWIVVDPDDGRPLEKVIQPWQARDFTELDSAWMELAGLAQDRVPTRPAIRRAFIERPRGHSKTSDTALQIAWILLAARRSVSGLAAAADREQAGLIHRAIRQIAELNRDLCTDLSFVEHAVRNSATGSRLEVISSDVRSSWGALPDFVVCDELCHWERPDLWYSLLSSAAKKPHCVLVVLTNAGVGRGWQWEVREHARSTPSWYFSSLRGPQAPWITDDWLSEQKALLPSPVFERLWLNIWQHSDGEFVSLAEAEACRDDTLSRQERGLRDQWYVAAVDYAEKHDFTVGCVCHHDGARIVVDLMDVICPAPDCPTPVQWVEEWIEHVARAFRNVRFIIDEHQLIGTIQKIDQRVEVQRFDFAAGRGNHRLATLLRRLIIHRQVAWYPGCGEAGKHGRDDLETELAGLLLRQSASGRLRIDHPRDGVHHDDRAFALGAACLALSEQATTPDVWTITPPDCLGQLTW